MKFRQLALTHPDDLRFGTAPRPLRTRHGLHLGGGLVYPELNFTLPPMEVTPATMPEVARHYRQIITGALVRAGVAAARCAVDLLRAGHASGRLKIAPRETGFLDTMAAQLDDLPDDEAAFVAQQMAVADASRYLPAEYGL